MYTHNLAVFVLVVPVIFLVLKRNWRLLSYVILAQFVIGVLSISWIWMIPGQVTKIQQAFWTPRPGITEVFQAIIMFSATLPLPGIWLIIGAIVSIQLIVVIIYEAIRGKLLFQANGQLILSFFFIPPILLFIVSYVMRPVFVPRGFIFSSLAYAGLAGILIAMNWHRGAASVIGIGFITAACISLPYQILFAQFPRSPFRETVTFLQNQIGTGSIVLHDNKLSYLPALFYSSTLPQKFLADEPGSPNDTFALATQNAMGIYPARNISEATDQFTKVYFVVFSETIQEYSGKDQKQNHPQLNWLELNYRRGAHWNFNDLEVFEFSR
jgi:mannosyltransferase